MDLGAELCSSALVGDFGPSEQVRANLGDEQQVKRPSCGANAATGPSRTPRSAGPLRWAKVRIASGHTQGRDSGTAWVYQHTDK